MAGVVHIPWYSNGLRGDRLEAALAEIAPVSIRYGAEAFSVYRSRDDRHKFLQTATFESKLDWERYWNGQEFIDWRVIHGGYWQVPVLYVWNDMVCEGRVDPPELVAAEWTGAPEPEPSEPPVAPQPAA